MTATNWKNPAGKKLGDAIHHIFLTNDASDGKELLNNDKIKIC